MKTVIIYVCTCVRAYLKYPHLFILYLAFYKVVGVYIILQVVTVGRICDDQRRVTPNTLYAQTHTSYQFTELNLYLINVLSNS